MKENTKVVILCGLAILCITLVTVSVSKLDSEVGSKDYPVVTQLVRIAEQAELENNQSLAGVLYAVLGSYYANDLDSLHKLTSRYSRTQIEKLSKLQSSSISE